MLQAAEKEDPVAVELLQRCSQLVAEQVSAAAARISEGGAVKAVFIGGLIDHETVYQRILQETLLKVAPSVEVCAPDRSPVEGAILMARQLQTSAG